MSKINVPDIATKFTYTFSWDNKPSTFRVVAWLKAVPVRYNTFNDPNKDDATNAMMDKVFHDIFMDKHPNWHHEYRLMHCTREEATHIEGSGIAGCTVALNDPRAEFSHEYVGWNKETIEEERERAIRMIPFYNEYGFPDIITGEWHD